MAFDGLLAVAADNEGYQAHLNALLPGRPANGQTEMQSDHQPHLS
jgi:hypothetical protein